jgi:transcriptional regulator of acetoin/glycerol metabolism
VVPIQLDHLPADVRQSAARARFSAERPAVAGDSGSGERVSGSGERVSADAWRDAPMPGYTDPGVGDGDDLLDPGSAPVTGPLSDEDRRLREEVIASLRAHGGNISAVARAMGKDRKQIQRWVKRFDLDPQSFR